MKIAHTLPFILFSVACSADSIFQIDYTATIRTGTMDVRLTDNTMTQIALTNARVVGHMDLDLAKAPAAVITGGLNEVSSLADPEWLSGSFAIQGLNLPSNALPVPVSFTQGERPTPVNANATTATISQNIFFARSPNQGPETISALGNFSGGWVIPNAENFAYTSQFAILLSQNAEFDTSASGNPAPFSFSTSTPVFNDTFFFLQFDATVSQSPTPHFVYLTDYSATGMVGIDTARGYFVTPEPASLGLVGFCLVLAGGVCRKRC